MLTACQAPLPFKLPTGKFYFEAVEALPGAAKRFREGFLALCPNHAAMYQYASHPKDEMRTGIWRLTDEKFR